LSNIREKHPVYDGAATVFRTKASGDVWQFRMYIRDEHSHYRKSLKTRDLTTALQRGREHASKLLSDVHTGRKIFGITLQELVVGYIDYRSKEVRSTSSEEGGISAGRLVTIKSQLKHLLNIKGGDLKVSELDKDTLYDWRLFRKEEASSVRLVTIRNEQATLNHMSKWAYRTGLLHFSEFNFATIRIRQDEIGKRDTFTLKEYDNLCGFMRSWTAKKNNDDDEQRRRRLIVRDYVLISSNSLLRVGEARQLKWRDLENVISHDDSSGRSVKLAHINVRWETSKVRNSRFVICRGGEYFERLRKNTVSTDADDFVFCFGSGDKQISARDWARYWSELMENIGIIDWKVRNMTWYSLRHFGITCRVKSGMNIVALSKMAGTSISHIENTYMKFSADMATSEALKHFKISDDGLVISQ
jgi:integrase